VKLAAIVLAAGSGSRFGGAKHDVLLAGRPAWRWSTDLFDQMGIPVILVGPLPGGVGGGERRRDSVAAGLDAVPPITTHVLVQDAARPLISRALVERVVGALEQGAAAVIPAVPVTDTVKRVVDGTVVETVDRTELVSVQTPQGFEIALLRRVHAQTDDDVPDDAALVEAAGIPVTVVPGDPENRKITYRADHYIAEATVRLRGDTDG
jgi:2-C-methyl-D-erythritol 4-phosphate cytidylyltransferase